MLRGHGRAPQHKGGMQVGRKSALHRHLLRLSPRSCPTEGDTRQFLKLSVKVTWRLANAGLQPAKAHHLQPHRTPPASPGVCGARRCQGCLPARLPHTSVLPPHPAPWESPQASHASSVPCGWAAQSCKTLLSSRAFGGLPIRVKIIIIFWLRKWSCKASEATFPGLPPPKPGSYSPKKNISLSSSNEAFQIIPQSWRERGFIWSTAPFQSWLNTKRYQFIIIIILLPSMKAATWYPINSLEVFYCPHLSLIKLDTF